jgi:DNA-binding Xre family transcriptional regulator
MSKKHKSTYDEFVHSLTSNQKKSFDEEYRDLLVSEMLIAMMHQDNISVRKLAEKSGISPTIIQGIRSGVRKNVSMQSFFKILQGLGYDIIAERKGSRITLDFSHMAHGQGEGAFRRK